jgi:hypothetical protein
MSHSIHALMLACAAVLSVSVAQAATSAEQVQIHGQRGMSSSEFDQLRGEYDLADGSRLSFAGTRLHPMAQIDAHGPVALVRTGPNQFTDLNGQLRLDIQAAANGSVSGVTVTYTRTG